jgi:hypothetical protein
MTGRCGLSLALHFALVDAHGRIVAGREPKSQWLPEGLSLEYLCM